MATNESFAFKVASMQTPESLVDLAQNEGFAITEEQAKAGLAKIKCLAEKGKTLNDEEIDEVAGGLPSDLEIPRVNTPQESLC